MNTVVYDQFDDAIVYIAKGLKEKYQNQKGGDYTFNANFRHGLNMLYFFAFSNKCFNSNGNVIAPSDETVAINQYFCKPLNDCFNEWNQELVNELKRSSKYFNIGPLIETGYGSNYILTNELEELLDAFGQNVNIGLELEQKRVYEDLKKLNQEDYVAVRKFIVEHPTISGLEFLQMQNKFKKPEILMNAYEEITEESYMVCPNCGWTLEKDVNGNIFCQHPKCIELSNGFIHYDVEKNEKRSYRLKKGVMRFIAYPGQLELSIYNECLKTGLKAELFPEMDTFDVEITFKDQTKWCVDAKSYENPYLLKSKIEEDGGFPNGDYQQGFYVVPDESKNKKDDYCIIINKFLKEKGQINVKCLTLKEFKKKLKQKNGGEGNGNE